jgi:hypothetical protein
MKEEERKQRAEFKRAAKAADRERKRVEIEANRKRATHA